MPLDSLGMDERRVNEAARILWDAWSEGRRIRDLPADCRPGSLDDGYAIQRAVAGRSGSATIGWKIAATSKAGQAHIGVDEPLAGRLLECKAYRDGDRITAGPLHMGVAEAEFAFRVGRDLPLADAPFSPDEAAGRMAALHVAIEIPDTRFDDFVSAGAAQLAADSACAEYFVLGPAAPEGWRDVDLAAHPVEFRVGAAGASSGSGANVLGDPRIALAWLANDRAERGEPLRAGEIVTTGTCVIPVSVGPGDEMQADFGPLGTVAARLEE